MMCVAMPKSLRKNHKHGENFMHKLSFFKQFDLSECDPCRDPSSGVIVSLKAKLTLSDTDYKKTPKVTWLADTDHAPATPTVCVIFDHLITKGVLKPEDNFKDFVNYNSKVRQHLIKLVVIVFVLLAGPIQCTQVVQGPD